MGCSGSWRWAGGSPRHGWRDNIRPDPDYQARPPPRGRGPLHAGVSGAVLQVTWAEPHAGPARLSSRSPDTGVTVEPAVMLSDGPGPPGCDGADTPHLAVDGSTGAVVWTDGFCQPTVPLMWSGQRPPLATLTACPAAAEFFPWPCRYGARSRGSLRTSSPPQLPFSPCSTSR